ncbi:tetratricopeptide repeat protein [Actinosynnema sp. NPDC020468]|uniref:ATP-binding protein n=1 Tax=Actinosynnema sp. NPDC020468 TaxID=3154488 RepID=UPI003400D1ED
MDDRSTPFGRELRRLRVGAGYSLARLATLAFTTKGQLSKLENGLATPAPDVVEACEKALRANGSLRALAVGARRPVRPAGPNGLPPVTRYFTGRRYESERLAAALREPAAAVVLSGMAGVGKTELAVRAAREAQASFPDGCLFLDLRGYHSGGAEVTAEDALDTLLRTLGVPGDAVPPDLDGRANVYRDLVRGKRVLLVLDNAADTDQVRPLLSAEPGCRVLVTSRKRLDALDDAVGVQVGELPAAEAAELFRATAGDREGDVARVVELCGGLPLAVRIAAAVLRSRPMLTVDLLADRLAVESQRLRALVDGERSVEAAFALSLDGLPEPQRRMFGLLGLHPGGEVEVAAAAALGGLDPLDADTLLGALDHANLLTLLPDDRVRLHDLLRLFAVRHVLPGVPVEERERAVRDLLDHALRRLHAADERIAPHRYRPDLPAAAAAVEGFEDREAALAWLDREWRTLAELCRIAIDRGLSDLPWRFTHLLHGYLFQAKLWTPWIALLEEVVAATRAAGERRPLAITLNNLGVARFDRGDLEPARRDFLAALEIHEDLADRHGITSARSNLAWIDHYLGEHDSALHHLGVALAAYRDLGNDRNAAITLRGTALVEVALHRHDDAVAHAVRAGEEFVRLGLDLDLVMTWNALGWAYFAAGKLDLAADHYRRALEGAERIDSRYEAARARTGLGNAAAAAGENLVAARHWADADEFDGVLTPLVVGEARARADLAGTR